MLGVSDVMVLHNNVKKSIKQSQQVYYSMICGLKESQWLL